MAATDPRTACAFCEVVAGVGLHETVYNDGSVIGVFPRQNSAIKAQQGVFHFHLEVVTRYPDDTLLPGS